MFPAGIKYPFTPAFHVGLHLEHFTETFDLGANN